MPAYWVWLNPDSGIGEEIFFGEPDPHSELTLVYLELAPLRAHTVSINVNVKYEEEIRKWLIEHGFL